jgi:cell division septation protein DedD
MTQIDSRRSQDETSQSTAQVVETVSEDKGVTPSQVGGAALASVTAAVAGSTLGVAGTVIGAALASVIATVGSAYYAAWLRRGRSVVLRTTKAGTARLPVAVPARRMSARLRELPWKRVCAVAAAALVLGIAALTAVELAVGKQIADVGREGGGGGTTWGGGGDGQSDRSPDQRDQEQTPQNPQNEDREPSEESTEEPSEEPSEEPTEEPAPEEPTEEPTPSPEPTETPVEEPTAAPTTPAPAG